jgi:hypothetical protein
MHQLKDEDERMGIFMEEYTSARNIATVIIYVMDKVDDA